jgi:hypothetical protein
MLVPLTRKTLERLIPVVATDAQYRYCWGRLRDLLRRLLISVTAVVIVLVVTALLGSGAGFLRFILAIVAGLYWLWVPVYIASRRNAEYRRYPYGGLWQGEVLDVYVTEELIGEEETVNNRGELVIVENLERRLNLEVGDETDFFTQIQVPLQREHKGINPGQTIQMVILSKDPNLTYIAKLTDAYIPNRDIWVSAYPYLDRNVFAEVIQRIENRKRRSTRSRTNHRSTSSRSRWD